MTFDALSLSGFLVAFVLTVELPRICNSITLTLTAHDAVRAASGGSRGIELNKTSATCNFSVAHAMR